MTPSELAAELKVSRWTIRAAIADGRLSAHRYGKRDFSIDRDEADRYIARCRVKPAPIVKRGGRLPREHSGDLLEIGRRLTLREIAR